jgi:ComF family protein
VGGLGNFFRAPAEAWGVLRALHWLGQLGLRILAPPYCAACDAPLATDAVFCAVCAATVATPPETVPGGVSAAGYGGAVASAIARFKFRSRPDLARPLAHLLVRAHMASGSATFSDFVIPVPLHRARLRERGYNQAALLARPLAAFFGVPCVPGALSRVRAAPPQATLNARDRATNLIGSFRANHSHLVRGKRILLVDDVRTTGATLRACETALMEVGAARVRFLTVAQA